MKFYSYRRVSKDPKDTGSVSLEWQASEIRRWLSENKKELSEDFCDDGVSARRPLRARKGGAALVRATAGGNCTVIVAKVDRIFRDTQDFLVTVNEWARRGVILESVNDRLDLVSPAGEFMATVMAAVNQLERRTVGERNKTRGIHRKESGQRYLRDAPYGFRFDGETTDENGKKSGGTLVKDDLEQAVLLKISQHRGRGFPLRHIAEELNKGGVPTRRGRPWSHSTIRKLLNTMRSRLSKKRREDGKGHAAPDLTIHVEPDEKDGEE
jgi:DNA invertase Pin-like site-specific DNA recombinase